MRENGGEQGAPLRLVVVTPQGIAAQAACDSVVLPVAEAADGTPGGTVGVRRGHVPALLALSAGTVVARLRGQTVLRASVAAGLAAVVAALSGFDVKKVFLVPGRLVKIVAK